MTPEDRAWEVVRRAFEERTPASHRRRRGAGNRLVLALVAVLAAGAVAVAVITPPGHAVLDHVRRAVGIEHAAPQLVSLPARGRLLVVSPGRGSWVVDANGLRRRLGTYEDAMWSPHGLFVVATTPTDLLTLQIGHGVRWSLPRPGAYWPRWEGTLTDTRIAYMTSSGLRVVAGDGTGDHLLDRRAHHTPPAWDPARLHTIAYAAGGTVVLRNADTAAVVWRAPITIAPTALSWSSDGRLLAVVSPREIVLLRGDGTVARTVSTVSERFVDAAFRPRTHELAVSMGTPATSEISLVAAGGRAAGRVLFAGPGRFGDIVWAPNGSWLLVDWPTANQWVFLRGVQVHAVSNIEQQFPTPDRPGATLQLDDRWCCAR